MLSHRRATCRLTAGCSLLVPNPTLEIKLEASKQRSSTNSPTTPRLGWRNDTLNGSPSPSQTFHWLAHMQKPHTAFAPATREPIEDMPISQPSRVTIEDGSLSHHGHLHSRPEGSKSFACIADLSLLVSLTADLVNAQPRRSALQV